MNDDISEAPTGASIADVNDRGGKRRGSYEVTLADALVEAPYEAGIRGGGKHGSHRHTTSAEATAGAIGEVAMNNGGDDGGQRRGALARVATAVGVPAAASGAPHEAECTVGETWR